MTIDPSKLFTVAAVQESTAVQDILRFEDPVAKAVIL
jgi:hypothetical protein